jgi:hypothetical protein
MTGFLDVPEEGTHFEWACRFCCQDPKRLLFFLYGRTQKPALTMASFLYF